MAVSCWCSQSLWALLRAATSWNNTHSDKTMRIVTKQCAQWRQIRSKQTLSLASATRFAVSEKLEPEEIRNLLLCFLHVINNLPTGALHGFWRESTTEEQIDFFDVLEWVLMLDWVQAHPCVSACWPINERPSASFHWAVVLIIIARKIVCHFICHRRQMCARSPHHSFAREVLSLYYVMDAMSSKLPVTS